jgi:hypothetical protein
MTVAIISGREGTGKTTQILAIAKAFPPVMWGVLELKDKKKLEREQNDMFSVKILYDTHSRAHEKPKSVDSTQTLRNVAAWKNLIMALTTLPQTIVLDGISDLRDYAMEAWLSKHNEETGKTLTAIKYKDWGAWGEVNSAIKDILEPLINLALDEDINLFLTAQMKYDYVNDIIVGYTPDVKPWMSYPVQCLFTLSSDTEGYTLECEKEPENARWVVEHLEKGKGLLTALLSHDVLTVDTETKKKLLAVQKTYILRYTENGENKRVFVEGTNTEEVKKAFEEDNPEAKEVSVTE